MVMEFFPLTKIDPRTGRFRSDRRASMLNPVHSLRRVLVVIAREVHFSFLLGPSSFLFRLALIRIGLLLLCRVDKKRDKLDRQVLDSQERAFWDVHRPAVSRALNY